MNKNSLVFLLLLASLALGILLGGCESWGAASAEEYFAIGMAYYDIGKYDEAEKWLNRAKAKDKTKNASEYNLGRIAFEAKRYDEAVKHFETVLKRDPNNVLALKAAAYTHIKNNNIVKAGEFYKRLLAIVPESFDDGYNYALVLFAMKKFEEAEQVLKNYEFALLDNSDVLLLFARAQKEQGKPEAIDSYASWLANNSDPKVRYEYAQLLEDQQMYARALEELKEVYTALSASSVDPSRSEVRFNIARLTLTADAQNAEGATELKEAVKEGYNDIDEIEKLLSDDRISVANKNEIRAIVTEKRKEQEAQRAAAEEAAKAEAEKAEADEAVQESETVLETETGK
ncbi:MAG: tetratricopeptide repeat protein [Treponema sp.]|jgi:tetratricopeptide (TPR) repeat protein|nr:tetratricopeptide repeat protein [Treponema sp.]